MNFEFQNPYFLLLLFLLPILYFLKGREGKSGSIIFSSIRLTQNIAESKRARFGGFLFFLKSLALVSLIIALARPQMGRGESIISSSGIDIVLTVDISGSMLALDFAKQNNITTRLDVAKSVLTEFIQKRPNDRIGLIAFATDSFLVSPLTLNHEWLTENVDRLKVGLIDPTGTAIGTALGMSINRLRDLNSKSRIVILLTDGANNAGTLSPLIAGELASKEKTKVYTIAIGSGGVVPILGLDKNGEYQRDLFGNIYIGQTVSDSDDGTLQKIADLTGGKYYTATDLDQLKSIYGEINQLEKSEVHIKHYGRYDEIFWITGVLGLSLLFLELILSNTRFRRLP